MGFVVRLINLDRSQDRLAAFRVCNPNLPFERVAAVDGKRLNRDSCIQNGLITPANTYDAPSLGIAASHIGLWQACAAGSEPFHIAEDDTIFHRDFVAMASDMLAKLGTWDIVFWGFNFDWSVEVEIMPAIGATVISFDQDAMRARFGVFRECPVRPFLTRLLSCAGIAAYSISPEGARRYLERCLPIADKPARYVFNGDTKRWLKFLDHCIPITDAGIRHILDTESTNWLNYGLDVEMARHHADLHAFACVPPLAITPNDHARSTARGAG